MHRRTFLRGAGVALALPLLDALQLPVRAAGEPAQAVKRRMVCINTPLGLHPPYFFPEKAGTDYELSPYLEVLKDFRDDFTVISGLSHPDVGPSHDSNYSFLTAAPHPERAGRLPEQHLARPVRGRASATARRGSPRLPLSCEGFGLSWTRSGAPVPTDVLAVERVRQAVSRRPARRGRRRRPAACRTARASSTRSASRPKRLQPALGADDREKLDEYFTSVRELEQRLAQAEAWSKKPKPKVDAKPPQNVTNPRRPDRQDAALVRPDPPGDCRPIRRGSSRCNCWAPAACRRSRA